MLFYNFVISFNIIKYIPLQQGLRRGLLCFFGGRFAIFMYIPLLQGLSLVKPKHSP